MQPQSETGSGTTSELASNAKQIGSSAVNRAHSEVDARKDQAVTQARSVSSAIERAADGLDEGAPAWLRSAFQQGAQQVQKLADTIEQKDSRQLVQEINSFARNSPGTFLAACAAVGFAAARVMKAGAEGSSQSTMGSGGTTGGAMGGSSLYDNSASSGSTSEPYGDSQSGFASENYSSEIGTGSTVPEPSSTSFPSGSGSPARGEFA